jgi:serine/threonine protein kinase
VLLDLSLMRRIGVDDGGGTFDYLSPEQARCGRVTEASDVWGLGATLFTTVTGEPPYADWTSQRNAAGDRHYPQLEVDPPRLAGRRNIDRRLGALIDACLERDPSARIGLDEAAMTLTAIAGFDPRTVTET